MKTALIRVLQIMGKVENGGVETVVMSYYRNIDKLKVQFDFVMHKGSNKNYIDEVKSMGGKVYEVTPYTKNIIKFTYEIYNIVKEGNYQIVHSNMNALSAFPLLAAYFAGAKVRILHNHTTDSPEERLRTLFKRGLRPFAKVFANRYWACSKLAGEWMYGKETTKNGKVTIINNAIDLDKFAFNQEKRDLLRKGLGLEEKFVIGHIGRFVKAKNHSFLIDIFRGVVDKKENAVLLLIGEGPLMGMIKEKVNQLGLTDKVIFLGTRNDVADLYNIMDVFVLPSLYEGLPVVGVECQANGLPFLCSDKVTREVIFNETAKQFSLNASIKYWVENLMEVSDHRISETRKYTYFIDYDINIEIIKVEKIYTSFGV